MVLPYLYLLCGQQEVQAAPFRLSPHRSQHKGRLVMEDHEDRGHCHRHTDRERESHA